MRDNDGVDEKMPAGSKMADPAALSPAHSPAPSPAPSPAHSPMSTSAPFPAPSPEKSSDRAENQSDDGVTLEESLTDELAALIDDGRTYAEAELTYQKTRAALAGKKAGSALINAILALILLHITLIALAVGAVLALAPLITIWGAIALVVGALLIGVAILALRARNQAVDLGELFSAPENAADKGDNKS